MLTAAQFDSLSTPIVDLYETYNQSVINDIARRLVKLNMTSTAAWQMQRLTESGKVYEKALEELSRLTGKSEATLRKLFEDAGVKAIRFDDAIYKAAGLNPIPLNLSPSMLNVLLAGLRKTNAVMRNLTMTTALTGQQAFVNAADLAYMQVSSGAMSYDQAVRAAVKQVAADGLSMIQYGGKADQLDVSMRRTVLTGVAQTTGNLTMARADEMGTDLVQTSAHAGARPTHEVWQGKVFSRSGTNPKYPDFVSSTDYGSVTGLCGINCRHSFYPFFEGLSENAYSQEALNNDYNGQTVTYQGNEIDQYKASQIQRSIEVKIRDFKRQVGALDAAGLDNSAETAKVSAWQAQMRDFIRQTDLQRQRVREQI
jgi:hypothetical protein